MVNFALNVSQHQGMTPLADSAVYQKLLGTKYSRAVNVLGTQGSKIHVTDLSFAIFDELVPAERLAVLTFGDIVKYRKETEVHREAFLEHIATLQSKQGAFEGGDYSGAIKDIVAADIIPEARKFKNAVDDAYAKLFGNLVKTTLSYLGGGAALQIFGDISWANLLRLAGLAGAAIGKTAMDATLEVRADRRNCAISYVLGLEK